MSSFLLKKKKHMREALLFYFNLKKSAAESHRMLVKAYGDNALSETTCRDWFAGPIATILTWQEAWKSAQEGWGLSIVGSFGRGRYPIANHINHWSNCTVLCVKKGRIIGKDMTSWFSSTTTHHRTRQQWSKTTWRHSTGKCYPIPLTHQIWHLLTITVFVAGHERARWAALRFLRRRPKMAWWVACFERWGIFLAWYTQIARKMEKIYS